MSPISSTTTVAHCDLGPISIKRKVLHSVFHRFWLPNNTGQFQAKGQLRSLTWGQFRATARLRTVFWTSFSFIRNVAHFKQNDSCALWFGANVEPKDNCAQCFPQVLSFKQIDTCAVWFGAISSNRKVLHSVFHLFWLPNNTGHFQAKRQLRSPTSGQFWATAGLRTVFWTSLSFI